MLRRQFHVVARLRQQFQPDPNYQLKCGLEIHTQLQTKHKLFSLSPTSFNAWPNSNVSYFDCGLPGTQPKLNPEALYLALKTAVALECDVQPRCSFDRKHYFYPDQPLGFQITQHYHPLAKNGHLELNREFDGVRDPKTIRIEQIQIEQDTGKTTYNEFDGTINVDLNRSNTPLIELVTKPDFDTIDQVKAFVKKYQLLVKHLGICSGELDTGAIRVDVNVSVNGHNRVEIKNLNSHSEIQHAIIYEYGRQRGLIEGGETVEQETRGWTGDETVCLRKKENAVDYRYFPDSELPKVELDPSIASDIRAELPPLPEQVMQQLVVAPYGLELKYARFFVDNPELLAYYHRVFDAVGDAKTVNNWMTQELLAAFAKRDQPLDLELIPSEKLTEIISHVKQGTMSLTLARHLLYNIVENRHTENIAHLIEHYDLGQPDASISSSDLDEAIEEVCREIMEANADVVAKVKKGKAKSLKYLVGLAMRETQGKIKAQQFEAKFKQLI